MLGLHASWYRKSQWRWSGWLHPWFMMFPFEEDIWQIAPLWPRAVQKLHPETLFWAVVKQEKVHLSGRLILWIESVLSSDITIPKAPMSQGKTARSRVWPRPLCTQLFLSMSEPQVMSVMSCISSLHGNSNALFVSQTHYITSDSLGEEDRDFLGKINHRLFGGSSY